MKFTTPAIASAPYTDDAPPVIVSTRATAAEGIELMLIAPSAFTGMPRRPSIKTRLRFAPRPRRLKVDAPGVFVALACTSVVVNGVTAGTNCGIWFMTVSRPTDIVLSNASSSTVRIGLFASKSRRTMRDPVTVISSRAGAAASWARMAPGKEAPSNAEIWTASDDKAKRFMNTFPPRMATHKRRGQAVVLTSGLTDG